MRLPSSIHALAVRLLADRYLGDPRRRREVGSFLDRVGLRGLFREMVAQVQFRLGMETSWAGPRAVRFEVTNHCNLRCVMCPQPETMQRPKQHLDFELYRRFLEDNPGLEEVDLFNWGESLLHPQIFDFVAEANTRGLYSRLVTNAVLLDERRARGLIQAGLRAIFFSIDGLGERYQAIRGIPIARPLANVRAFLELKERLRARVFTGINITHSEWNRGEADTVARELEALGADGVEIQLTEDYSPKYRRRVACPEPYRYLVVLSNAKVVPCCVDYEGELAFGSIAEQTRLPQLYNAPKIRQLRRDLRSPATMPRLCSSCTFKIPARERPRWQRHRD